MGEADSYGFRAPFFQNPFIPNPSSRNLPPETIHPDKITLLEKHNLKTDVNAVSHPVLISQSSSVNELPIQ